MASSSSAPVQKPSRGTLARLVKDYKEVIAKPIPGVSITPINDDIFNLHCNLVIPEGPYTGLCVHMVLTIPSSYPSSSPAGSICSGFPFGQEQHAHIHGVALCNDYLSNYEGHFRYVDGGQIKAGTGWSPAITLSSLLMVLKNFLADIDLEQPHPMLVKGVFEKAASYVCTECGHSTATPYPPIPDSVESPEKLTFDPTMSIAVARAEEHLVCSTEKVSYIKHPNMVLGYPIKVVRCGSRMDLTVYPMLISYCAFAEEIQRIGTDKLDLYNTVMFKTATGDLYNHWLPIYINGDHFYGNLQCMKNTISVIAKSSFGNVCIRGSEANEFEPHMVLQVLPMLMNKMVVQLVNGDVHGSEAAIFAYCHYLRLLRGFMQLHPELHDTIDETITKFVKDVKFRSKQYVPDIGQFIIWISLSKKYNYLTVKNQLLEEYFARQVFWINKGKPDVQREPPTQRLKTTFELTKVSNSLLVFNLMMVKYFGFDGVEEQLDANFGLPPDIAITSFQKVITGIKEIEDYKQLMKLIGHQDKINSEGAVFDMLNSSIAVSIAQGYTRAEAPAKAQTSRPMQRGRGYQRR